MASNAPTIDFSGLPEIVNKVYYPLFWDESRYLVLYGSAGSGKSVFITQKIVKRVIEEKGHKFLVIRKVGKTLRESVFAEFRNTISTWGLQQLFKINKTDMTITCLNGNQIIFAGLDDVEKLKSISGITGIWIEEASEIDQSDVQQLDLRLRGKTNHYKQIILSFNPVSILHWLKAYFFDSPPGNCKTVKTTYKDNRFLDQEYIRVLLALKDVDPYYYTVYALGEWGVIGKTIFPAQIVSERISYLQGRQPLMRGHFVYMFTPDDKIDDSSITWVSDPDGYISIYANNQPDKFYVIGGDTAGEGSDYFTGQVLDAQTGVQVATLRHQTDEDLYARQIYCLGKAYNTALISIEANFSTYPIKELQRLGYRHQYRRESVDQITNKKEYRYGWLTTAKSRPLAIANLVRVVREQIDSINDLPTLEEMLTFVRNSKGKAEAQEGKHDDLILGLAIAHQARGQSYMEPSTGSFLPGENLTPVRYNFHTEAGRDEDDDDDYSRSGSMMTFYG